MNKASLNFHTNTARGIIRPVLVRFALTTLFFVRVVAAVVHFVADLVRAQTHVIVSTAERPRGGAGKLRWGTKDTNG